MGRREKTASAGVHAASVQAIRRTKASLTLLAKGLRELTDTVEGVVKSDDIVAQSELPTEDVDLGDLEGVAK